MSDDDPDEYSDITQQVLAELDPGDVIEDKVILSKRQAALIIGGPATLAGVLGVGTGRVSAQTDPDKLGTAEDPLDADLGNYGSTSTADGYEFTIEGNTFEVPE